MPLKRFVGRARELALIDDAATRAEDGYGQMLLVCGETGVGKTRLAEEVVERMRQRGLPTAWGRCWPGETMPPLWPWPAVIEQLCGPDAAERLTTDAGGTVGDHFALARLVADLVRSECRERPAVAVIDDVHGADVGSLLLARHLAASVHDMPLVVVLTCRPWSADDRSATTRELVVLEHLVVRIDLGRFTLGETRDFLCLHGHPIVETDMLHTIQRMTGGNPLSLRHLLALAATGDSPGDLTIGVGGIVAEIMQRLEPHAATVLARAAILGPTPSLRETAAVAGAPTAVILNSLRDARRAGLVTIDEEGSGFSFTHEAVQRSLIEHLDAAHLLDAHACAAAVIGAGDDGDSEHEARYAHHALRAASRSDDDASIAIDACRMAAAALIRAGAPARAVSLLEQAASVAEQCSLATQHAPLLVDWAEAALQCGRLGDARSLFRRAATAAEAEVDAVGLARAALGLGGIWLNEHRTLAEREAVRALQRGALAKLPAGEAALRCRLEVRLAAEAAYPDGPLDLLSSAVDAARALGDDRTLAEALSLWHHAIFVPRHMPERLAVAEELVTVASAAGDGLLTLMGLCWRTVDLFHLGDQRAERALAELHQRADDLDCAGIRYVARILDVMLLARAGLLDDAEAEAMACFDVGSEVGDADAMSYLSGQLLAIRWLQGRETELLAPVEDLASSPSLVNDEFAFRATAAFLAARAGDADRARYWLDRVSSGGLDALPQSSTWLAGMFALVEAAVVVGDAEVAVQAAALLEPYADLTIMPSLAVVDFGTVLRPIGLAALVAGDLDEAVERLDAAVDANRRLGNRPLTAITQADLAGALARRADPGDRERAIVLLREAAATAHAAGMQTKAVAMEVDLARLLPDDEATEASTPIRRGVLSRRGQHWVVSVDEREAVVTDLLGMRYLAQLMACPGVEITALRLAGGPDEAIAALDTLPHDVLDASTRTVLRRRVDDLREDIARAERQGDLPRAERSRGELDALVDAVREATGLRGRSRTFATPAERARTAVRKAIKRAIDEIGVVEPAIADHLRSAVSTGVTCCYRPSIADSVDWTVDRGHVASE